MIFTSSIPLNVRSHINITEYLAKRFTYHSALEWADIISDGRVSINGKLCCGNNRIVGGDTISYEPYDFEEPKANLSYSIIYEDDGIFCVNKPTNLLVHRAGKSFCNNLVYQLRHVNTPKYPDCRPIHRLDRDTSGAILIAKDAEQMRIFCKLFNDGQIVKIYKAVVKGCPNFEMPFVIDTPIAADNEYSGYRYKFKTDENGKTALTVIEHAQECGNNGFSLLTLRPITGRTHQIRVHLASIGFPIVGDKLYGTINDDAIVPRQALHCESLSFTHPHTGHHCKITAILPDDFI